MQKRNTLVTKAHCLGFGKVTIGIRVEKSSLSWLAEDLDRTKYLSSPSPNWPYLHNKAKRDSPRCILGISLRLGLSRSLHFIFQSASDIEERPVLTPSAIEKS